VHAIYLLNVYLIILINIKNNSVFFYILNKNTHIQDARSDLKKKEKKKLKSSFFL
jgi:hypothetical protein